MNVSAVGSGGAYVPYVAPHVTTNTAQPPVSTSQATDADGDHDGSPASPGRLDVRA